jgi:Iap family predicted aminopeptidase
MADFESRFDVEYDGEIPPSVDEAALRRMEAVAHALDEGVRIPGTNASVGIDPILSVIPVAGDMVGAGLSLYIVVESANLGVPYTTLLRMIANISVDMVGGSIPYVGTFFDSFWKANKRNVERALEELAEPLAQSPNDGDDAVAAVDIPVQAD